MIGNAVSKCKWDMAEVMLICVHSTAGEQETSSFLLLLLSPLFPGDGGGACLFSFIHIGALNSLRNSDSIYLESKSL